MRDRLTHVQELRAQAEHLRSWALTCGVSQIIRYSLTPNRYVLALQPLQAPCWGMSLWCGWRDASKGALLSVMEIADCVRSRYPVAGDGGISSLRVIPGCRHASNLTAGLSSRPPARALR